MSLGLPDYPPLPEHLGGHMNKVHTDRATLTYLIQKYDVTTMVDVGCGPGDMVQIACDKGMQAEGIDGDYTQEARWAYFKIPVRLHDFSKGKPEHLSGWDLAWSVEFLEHVDEQYMDNYMCVFEKCKYIICTAAPPGHPGHHHVNCQSRDYWIDRFSERGFDFDAQETEYIKSNSVMRKPFMQRNGMFYVRRD